MIVPVPGVLALKLVGATSTAFLAAGGWQAVGATGGVIGGTAGLIGTYIALRANARTARKEYQEEIAAAETRGHQRCRDQMQPIIDAANARIAQLDSDLAFWRGRAFPENPPPPRSR